MRLARSVAGAALALVVQSLAVSAQKRFCASSHRSFRCVNWREGTDGLTWLICVCLAAFGRRDEQMRCVSSLAPPRSTLRRDRTAPEPPRLTFHFSRPSFPDPSLTQLPLRRLRSTLRSRPSRTARLRARSRSRSFCSSMSRIKDLQGRSVSTSRAHKARPSKGEEADLPYSLAAPHPSNRTSTRISSWDSSRTASTRSIRPSSCATSSEASSARSRSTTLSARRRFPFLPAWPGTSISPEPRTGSLILRRRHTVRRPNLSSAHSVWLIRLSLVSQSVYCGFRTGPRRRVCESTWRTARRRAGRR